MDDFEELTIDEIKDLFRSVIKPIVDLEISNFMKNEIDPKVKQLKNDFKRIKSEMSKNSQRL